MRIDSISVDGFGVWHDARLEPEPGLTLIRGDNEAGKTTLLAFVRAILFGFETHRYPALTGGRRGGRLEVTMADERRFRIERYGDRGGEGTLRVIGDDDVDRGAAYLPRLLHGVEASLYRNVFAFRLDELSEFTGLTEGEVAARIYGAGLGTGAASALAVESALRSEAAGLFKTGGQNPAINQLLKQIEEVDRTLDRLDLPADYADRQARLVAAEAERDRAGERLAGLDEERRRLERIDKGWQHWLDWTRASHALAVEPEIELAPDALEHFSRLDEAARSAERTLEEIARRRSRLEAQIEALPDPSQLVEHGAEIEAVHRAGEAVTARRPTLSAAREELAIAERHAADALRQLGPGWDEHRAQRIDVSIPIRSAITGRFRASLDAASRDLARAEDDLRLVDRESEIVESDLAGLDRRLGALPGAMSAEPVARSDPLGHRRWAPALVVGGSLLAVVAGLVAGSAPLGVAVAAAGLAAAALIWSWPGRRPAAPFGSETAARAAGLAEQRRATLERRDSLAAARVEATAHLEVSRAGSHQASAAWADWLTEHGLDRDLDRETALTVLDGVAAMQVELRRRDELRVSLGRLVAEDEGFVAQLNTLLTALGRTDTPDVDGTLQRMARELREARQAADDRARLSVELVDLDGEDQLARSRAQEALAARDRLLTACGESDETGLRLRAERVSARARLAEEAATARNALTALSGPGDAVERLITEIAAVEEIAAERDRLAAIRGEIEAATAVRDAALAEIGALKHQIDDLSTSAEASELRQRRADLTARLEAEAERWSVRALAVSLLERTRQRYEREHRPGVIRTAEAFLVEWTNGRYRQIIAPLGASIEGVERADGQQVPLHGLSRGTAEQLYLALRFALIEHFADEAEPLPIVMDEILVNFDDERAERAARTIERLAERHQILYFTCRPTTPLNAPATIRLEPPTLGAAVGADRPPALERA